MQPILEEVDKIINGERQDMYGNPEDSFELIAHYWTTYVSAAFEKGECYPIFEPHDVAVMMTLFKIARMSGQKPCRDNSRDAIGYLAIDADRLQPEDKTADLAPKGEKVQEIVEKDTRNCLTCGNPKHNRIARTCDESCGGIADNWSHWQPRKEGGE